jgi:apolipoprotein D and lipocalin family protein
LVLLLLQNGCTGLPDNVTPVKNFELSRYLGQWYEIARLDHSFERNLVKVTAEYTMRDDGGVKVINRGYNARSGEWEEAQGKAYFVTGPDVGYLKVSFFGPFYGSYVIIDLDNDNYRYALVGGPDRSYLWILARTPRLDREIQQRLIAKAEALGYETDKLIFVSQE